MAFFIGFDATTVAMPSFIATLQVSICRANKRLNHWSVTSRGARRGPGLSWKNAPQRPLPGRATAQKIFLFFFKRARTMTPRGLIQRQKRSNAGQAGERNQRRLDRDQHP
jgi:hypothetical protein